MIASNVHYFYYPLEECFKSLNKAGFKEMELYLGTPHVFIDGEVTDLFSDVMSLCEKYKIKIIALHPETISYRYTLCHPDEQWNKKSLQCYEKIVDLAYALGVKRINTDISGGFLDINRQEVSNRIVQNLKFICDYAEAKEIDIGIECISEDLQGYITKLEEIQEIKSKVSSQNMLINLNFDAMKAAGEDLAAWDVYLHSQKAMIRMYNADSFIEVLEYCDKIGYDGSYSLFPIKSEYLDDPSRFDKIFAEKIQRAKGEIWG